VTLASGRADIIGHGMATTFEGAPLLIGLSDGSHGIFVRFVFRTDENAPTDQAQIYRLEDRLDVEMVNYQTLEGKGSSTPLWLNDWDGFRYYIHFRAFRFGQTEDVTVHYTFYRTLPDEAP